MSVHATHTRCVCCTVAHSARWVCMRHTLVVCVALWHIALDECAHGTHANEHKHRHSHTHAIYYIYIYIYIYMAHNSCDRRHWSTHVHHTHIDTCETHRHMWNTCTSKHVHHTHINTCATQTNDTHPTPRTPYSTHTPLHVSVCHVTHLCTQYQYAVHTNPLVPHLKQIGV